ncbi:hypothetical protein AK812_SmicGene14141 [Symbiodinium microadriaticum]|uniref:Uncharacterized protein n=1 Tax=Symbiodinium microadriaticum TaxID=2951 RepID=A0A1Q9E6A8_SYMMI|nr:hypothetical protein AK812_SmicGene14141 [Symbiodinium microadriaticum]
MTARILMVRAPLTSLPEPTGLANLHPPGSTLNAAALRDFVQGLGQWEVPKTVLDEAQPAVVPFDHEVEVKAALEEVQEAGLALHVRSHEHLFTRVHSAAEFGLVLLKIVFAIANILLPAFWPECDHLIARFFCNL